MDAHEIARISAAVRQTIADRASEFAAHHDLSPAIEEALHIFTADAIRYGIVLGKAVRRDPDASAPEVAAA